MGATQVQAMDFSAYEGAGLVHDLNQPIPPQWREQFDVVFDGGTLEHVFNFPVAIKNCMEMLKPKGRFVAVTMPNNWCGHGFYQFSPELFFRILSPANGFSIIDMYLTTLGGNAYTVIDPEAVRSRVELCNKIPVFLLVHARRDEVKEIFSQTPQQSDYVTQWNGGTSQQSLRLQVAWKNYPLIRHLRQFHMNLLMRRSLRSRSLGNRKFYRPADLSI
jgi:SAM-dependent methyltransferase